MHRSCIVHKRQGQRALATPLEHAFLDNDNLEKTYLQKHYIGLPNRG